MATICFQYPIQRYVADFVDIEKKIVFNVNGDFWHANPILYKEGELSKIQEHNVKQDKNKKIFLESRGWTVIDIWESEIYWNVQFVKNKIRATREKANPSVLHTEDTRSVTEVAHQKDWSEKLKSLWFRKNESKRVRKTSKLLCEFCKKEFEVDAAKKDSRKCCSRECYINLKWKDSKIPEKEQLKKDINNMSWLAIGRKYNVSDNAVRKWAKKYDL